jgi:hypothetical protein
MEQLMKLELAEKRKYSEKICPYVTFIHYKSQMTWPRIEPGLPRWEAGDY